MNHSRDRLEEVYINIVERFKKFEGPTDSKIAGLETIRGKYGIYKSINAIHGSGSRKEAIIEI